MNENVVALEVLFVAAAGVEDTMELYKKDYANFGYDRSGFWKELVLKNGTNVKFTNYLGRYGSIESIEWRNLNYCLYINLYNCGKVVSMDVSCLNNLKILIIWWSGLKIVDLTPLLDLEIVVCGNHSDGRTQQTVKVCTGVIKKVFDYNNK